MRRIAIVLRGLPEPVSRKLLAELDPETRTRVRREVAGLIDIDPMEQRRALESFTGSMRRGASRATDARVTHSLDGDEVQFSSAARNAARNADPAATDRTHRRPDPAHAAANPPYRSAAGRGDSAATLNENASLEFLSAVTDDDLLGLLQDEHPQTKAVVLAQIRPARAAALLPRLGASQRQDLLTRIGRLPNLPEEMLADVASSFRERVNRLVQSRAGDPLQSLVAALGSDSTGSNRGSVDASQHVPPAAAAVSPRLQAILAEMPSAGPGRTSAPANQSYTHDRRATDDVAETTAERLRRITRDEPDGPEYSHSDHENSTSTPPEPIDSRHPMSTDEIHQELIRMPPRQLCESLGRVGTRTAILALCGLPNKVADAAIACLPRAQANQVRGHLMAVGSLEIRDIDRAKEQIAAAARIGGRTPATNNNSNNPAEQSFNAASTATRPRVAVAM